MIEKSDESREDIAEKLNAAVEGWPNQDAKVRKYLAEELDSYESKPDFENATLVMESLYLQLTFCSTTGYSKESTSIVFEFQIPYENTLDSMKANVLEPSVVYKVGFKFNGLKVDWTQPEFLNLDFDAYAE